MRVGDRYHQVAEDLCCDRVEWEIHPQFERRGTWRPSLESVHQVASSCELLAGQLFLSEVCRSEDEVLGCQERWRAGLEEKGWAR